MKIQKNTRVALSLAFIATLGFFAGCASGPTIKFEADKTANLTAYKTYALIPMDRSKGVQGGEPSAGLHYAPIVNAAIKSALATKGYTEVPLNDADFAVHVAATIVPKVDVTDWGYGTMGYSRWGHGGYWAGSGMGYNNTTVTTYDEGILRIEIYDAKKKDVVWVGWAQDELTKSPEDAAVTKAVIDILANFPVEAPKAK